MKYPCAISKYSNDGVPDVLRRFRAEFGDVKSLADVARLSPKRLARFKHQFFQLEISRVL
jgi:hypothetical protein